VKINEVVTHRLLTGIDLTGLTVKDVTWKLLPSGTPFVISNASARITNDGTAAGGVLKYKTLSSEFPTAGLYAGFLAATVSGDALKSKTFFQEVDGDYDP